MSDPPSASYAAGPLPQWTLVQYGGPYEATDTRGVSWRLWKVDSPPADDPFPAGYRLAPRDEPGNVNFITGEHGLYYALDMAGLRIAGGAVRADPNGARRQLGFDDFPVSNPLSGEASGGGQPQQPRPGPARRTGPAPRQRPPRP